MGTYNAKPIFSFNANANDVAVIISVGHILICSVGNKVNPKSL